MSRSKILGITLALALLVVPMSAFAAPDNSGRHFEWVDVAVCVELRDGTHENLSVSVPEWFVDQFEEYIEENGGGWIYIYGYGWFAGATLGACPTPGPYIPCEEVVYGDTLEGLSVEMFGGPSYLYLGYLLVCESAEGDWGQGCTPALQFDPYSLVPGQFVCPVYSPGTGE